MHTSPVLSVLAILASLLFSACDGDSAGDAADSSGADASSDDGATADVADTTPTDTAVAPEVTPDGVDAPETDAVEGDTIDAVDTADTLDDADADTLETDDTGDGTVDTVDTAETADSDAVADTAVEDVPTTGDADDTDTDDVVLQPRLTLSGPNGVIDAGADDAGDHEVWVAFERAYVLGNDGDAALTIGEIRLSADDPTCELSLISGPETTVAPGESTTFVLSVTLLEEGEATCAFVVDSDDPTNPELRVEIGAVATPSTLPLQRAAMLSCTAGQLTIFGSTTYDTTLVASLTETWLDGTLVTISEDVGGCTVTTSVGTPPGGHQRIHAADHATCSTVSCEPAPDLNGQERCRQVEEGTAYTAGLSVMVTLEDALLDGTVSHTFPKAPGFIFLIEPPGSISRGAPWVIEIADNFWGGVRTEVSITQEIGDTTTTARCDFPSEDSEVTIPTAVLQRFDDGAFRLGVNAGVRHTVTDPSGFTIELSLGNYSLPQRSSYTFTP